MTTQPIRQQNYSGYVPILAILLIVTALLVTQSLIRGIDQTNEAGVSGGHANHEDTITTPLPGNTCPNGCPWPDCGCSDKPQLTLEPTVFISPFPTFDPQITPDIPDPINNATVFPTLVVDEIPALPTAIGIPTLIPTGVPGPIPTIERSIRDVDRPDGTGGGLD